MDSQYDVFISYSNADLEFVKRLEGELDFNGIVTLLPMDFYQKYTQKQQLTDGYCLLLISRKLTDAESNAISVYAKNACDYTYPVVISEEAFANWELFRELQNLDGIKTMTYLLNSEKKNEAIRSFESDQDRALALVKHFIELDNHVNNKV